MKTCKNCLASKNLSEFYPNKNIIDGYENKCKKCRNSASAKNYEANRERLKDVRHKWYEKNKEWYLPHCKTYAAIPENKDLRCATARRRESARRKTDINFKLKKYLRTRVYCALKGSVKSKNTMDLIGCSIDELKSHISQQFHPGMTWENYGKWHVDHIKPCASFDLVDPEQQKACFHFSNLQPLWAADNIRKSDKFIQ